MYTPFVMLALYHERFFGGNITYRRWAAFRYRVRGVVEQNVGPVSFLVDYTGEFSGIIVPWCGGFARETLDAAECSILLQTHTHKDKTKTS